jgi:hypothetical protein
VSRAQIATWVVQRNNVSRSTMSNLPEA